MARPQKRTAAKDYPNNGIAKGDTYWYVQIKTGPRSSRVMRQKQPFRRSQLTTSDYLAQLYDWEDTKSGLDDMESAQELADTIRALGEEQTAKYENMPEGLQQGDTGQMLEARAEACEAAAGDIEEIIARWESERDTREPEIEQYKEAYAAYAKDQELPADDREGLEEPTVPDDCEGEGDDCHYDASEYITEVQNVEVSE